MVRCLRRFCVCCVRLIHEMKLWESCTDCVNYEMRAESLGLNHDNPSDFVRSQWPINQKVFIIYRIFVSVGFISWLISDVLYETQAFFKDNPYTYMIYATNWSFCLATLTSLLMTTCTLYYSIRSGECLDRQTFERMPIALKVQWFLLNLSYNSAIVVTVSYWTFIGIIDDSKVLQTNMSHLKHTLNTAYVVLDIIIGCTPIRILHLLYAVGLGSVYSIFNAIYFLNDGTILEGRHYAYNILDWGRPMEAVVTCALCVVLCILSQLFLYEMYRIRSAIFTKIYFSSDGDKPDSEMQSIIGEAPGYMAIGDRGDGVETYEHPETVAP